MPKARVAKSKTKSRSKSKTRSVAKRTATKTVKTAKNSKSRIQRSKTGSKLRSKSSIKKITVQDAKKIGTKLNVDFNVVDPKTLQYGMNVELEHGYIDSRTNVTNNNLILTAKIALAHIIEYPDYYTRLKEMEDVAEKYWKNKKKPNPFKQ